MNSLLLSFKRSPLKFAILPLILLNIVMIFARDSSWQGIWPRSSCAAQLTSFYLAPIFAAFQAWEAGRSTRNKMDDSLYPSSRGSISRNLTELSVGVSAAWTVYTSGFVAVAIANVRAHAPAGFIWWGYYFLGLGVVVAGVATGHLAGVLVKGKWLSPVAACVAVFAGVATVGHVLNLVLMNGDAWFEVSGSAVLWRCLTAATLLLGAVLIRRTAPHYGRTLVGRIMPSTSSALVALMLAFFVAATSLSTSVQVERALPSHQLCTSSRPKICLWPDDSKYVSIIRQMHGGMTALPQGTFTLPTQFSETGLPTGPSGVTFSTSGGRLWGSANEIAIEVGSKSYPSDCVPSGENAQEAFTRANFNILGYLIRTIYGAPRPRNEGGGPPVNESSINSVVASPPASQRAWISEQNKNIFAPPCHDH